MVSHLAVIGALIYRTREALNKRRKGEATTDFYKGVSHNYKYWDTLFCEEDKMHLWHFAGTEQEITTTLETLAKGHGTLGAKLTFPCIFNYQSVYEHHGLTGSEGFVQLDLNLAIACPVDSNWTAEQRDRIAHKWVLEPIYDEFINQARKSGWFRFAMDEGFKFTRMKVFAVGTSFRMAIKNQYGWYIDVIQIGNFKPMLNSNLCEDEIKKIEHEATLVTDVPLINNLRTNK